MSAGPFSISFFQAEDGIRDIGVTGVQTCALPISRLARPLAPPGQGLRGATRGRRDDGQAGHDPPDAAPPRPPEPKAPACTLTSQTGSHLTSIKLTPSTPNESHAPDPVIKTVRFCVSAEVRAEVHSAPTP